jgi:hypothetical protein
MRLITAVVLAAILIFFVTGCFWAVDGLLPVEEMDTHIHHFLKEKDSLAYIVPGTGGGMDTCPVAHNDSRQLQPNAEIVVMRTLIFSRCVGVKPIRCLDIVCSSGHDDAIDANTFLREAIRYSYGDKYSTANELVDDYPGYFPEIRRWPRVRNPLIPVRYSMRSPEKLIIFSKDGGILMSRACEHADGLCKRVP